MKILRTYLLKEISVMFLFSLLVFTFALVTGNLIKLADLVINKGVDITQVGRLFLFLIPFLLRESTLNQSPTLRTRPPPTNSGLLPSAMPS